MKHNLMGKEKIENLGFDQVNSWDNEEKVSLSCFFSDSTKSFRSKYFWNAFSNNVKSFVQRKRDMFRKLCEIDKMAERNLHRMRAPESEIDNNLYHVWYNADRPLQACYFKPENSTLIYYCDKLA